MKLVHSLLIAYAVAGQAPQPPQVPASPLLDTRNAHQTRENFQQLLQQYPPSLRQIFQLDPSLLTNEAFLAPYPNLAAFLAQHPEIVHNPSFFVGQGPVYVERQFNPEARSYEMFEHIMAGVAVFAAGLIILSVLGWGLKTVIDHRRWLRVSKVQSEVHSKLLDRFTSNQDLLAYIQTPAGRHFLESAPFSIDAGTRTLSAPVGRILFSVQAGVVLALAGLGLGIVSRTMAIQEIAQPLFIVGMLALALGIGFVLSALVAYIMSQRLGLFDQAPLVSSGDNAGVSPPHA
jgi:hypothetical protein